MTIIEQLEDADKTLAADGYKEYSYVRIAISEAIRALRQPPVSGRSEQCAHEYKVDDKSDIPFDLVCQKCGKTG